MANAAQMRRTASGIYEPPGARQLPSRGRSRSPPEKSAALPLARSRRIAKWPASAGAMSAAAPGHARLLFHALSRHRSNKAFTPPVSEMALPRRGPPLDHRNKALVMQEFFAAVRENCPRQNWSRAVELARIVGVVTVEREAPTAVTLKVKASEDLMSRTVTLFLDDEDWTCDCPSKDDVCVHVAAAAIALNRARKSGETLPSSSRRLAQVEHAFRRQGGGLLFERFLVVDGERRPLNSTLSALASGRVRGPQVAADQADLAMDLHLGIENRLFPLRDRMEKLLGIAADCARVTLDGAPIEVRRTPLSAEIVRLTDHGLGFCLALVRSPELDEVFANGCALSRGALCPLAESRLTARERAELSQGRIFGAGQKIELMTEVLPELQARIRVIVETRRLPKLSDARARVHFEVARAGDALSILPTIVYGDPPVARVDSGRLVSLANEIPIRDELLEERLSHRLQRDLQLRVGHKASFDSEEAIAAVQKIEAWSRQPGEGSALVSGDALRQFHLAPPLAADLALGERDFHLSFDSIDAAGRRAGSADPAAVLRAFREGASVVPLIDGGFAPLPLEWLQAHSATLGDLLAAKQGRDALPACALPDLARLCAELGAPPPPAFEALRPLFEDFRGLPELPGDLGLAGAALRGYQVQGVRWLTFLKKAGLGALLADDMGLGKTLQALAVLEKPALVVAPTSVIHNWVAEAQRFRPELRICLFHGPARRLDGDADVTITSYALLRNELDLLKQVRWRALLLDEAQAIKNPASQVARAACALNAEFRIALTGTPIENRLDELWSQLNFLNPGLLGSRADFDERYARAIAEGVPGRAAALRERIRPFVLRRLKRDVAAELPPRTEAVLRCELSEEELGLYRAIHASTRQEVVDKLTAGGSVLAALEALLRMRQACCHPALIPGQSAERSSKVDVLVEKLTALTADGHKALVFSQWTRLLDLIEPHLIEAGIGFVRLDGSTRDRSAVVGAFQHGDGPPVMLISLKAGGVGLNLTAADHVFLVDPWWNPAVEDQASDRAHRIGQQRPVFIHRLVALGTVEERILALQQSKRALAEAALSGTGQATGLTREDLLALIGP